jgi:hypothetical protein
MERTKILELMAKLKLYGMCAAYDEVMTAGIKRRREPPRILGDLLAAEIAEKRARSIKYQLTIAKLPLAKDIDDFDFAGTPGSRATSSKCGCKLRNLQRSEQHTSEAVVRFSDRGEVGALRRGSTASMRNRRRCRPRAWTS